jgi:hypothetical protein
VIEQRPQAAQSRERRSVGSVPDASTGGAGIGIAPLADGVEVIEGEPERIHLRVAGGASRVAAMVFEAFPDRLRPAIRAFVLQRRHVGRRGGGGVPRMFSSSHLPRKTGDVRFG